MPFANSGQFQLLDFTREILKIPRAWNLVDSLGIFATQGVSTDVVKFDITQDKTTLISDHRRGGSRNFNAAATSTTAYIEIPFFPLDGAIRAVDLQNLRQVGTAADPANIARARLRIMDQIRRKHSVLREKAMVEAIKGNVYNVNGTVNVTNFYTAFGVTAQTSTIDFTQVGVDPSVQSEVVRRLITDAAQDGSSNYEIMALCGTGFFSALIAHPMVREAYEFYAALQNPNRDRLTGSAGTVNSIYRSFFYKGINYVEYTGSFSGTALVATNMAYYLPVGIADMFTVYHGPADRLDAVNTIGQELYFFEVNDPYGRRIDIQSETAMLASNSRPELVIAVTGTY